MRSPTFAALASVLTLAAGCKTAGPQARVKDYPADTSAEPSLWAGVRRDSVSEADFAQALATAKAAVGDAGTTLVALEKGANIVPDALIIAPSWTSREDDAVAPLWAVADVARTSGYAMRAATPSTVANDRVQAQVLAANVSDAAAAQTGVAHAFKAEFEGDKLAEMLAAHQKLVDDAGDKLKPYVIVCDHGYVLELVSGDEAKAALAYVWQESPLKDAVTADTIAYQAAGQPAGAN